MQHSANLLEFRSNCLNEGERVQRELAKSYHQVPPLNRVLVQKVIEAEFDVPADELFEQFGWDAIAAASLGQVHRAAIEGGKSVAVKIQYPEVHVSIENDLALLRTLLRNGVKVIPKPRQPNRTVLETSIDEIGARLKEETDYKKEAANTAWFKENLLIEGVEVPQVYPDFSCDRVVTTEMLDGLHLDAWLATDPAQQERDKAAQLIYDTFMFSTLKLRCLHADPNPGNYLFKTDGELALIDFGCVKRLRKRFSANLPQLLHAFYLNDFERIVSAYENVGMTIAKGNQRDYERVLRPFGEWLSRPVRGEFFDFKENNDYTSSGLELIKGISKIPSLETVEKDFIFFDRTMYGLFKIFERLEAKVYLRGHWKSLWTGL